MEQLGSHWTKIFMKFDTRGILENLENSINFSDNHGVFEVIGKTLVEPDRTEKTI
jgi:hypothetical protein